MNRQHNYTKEDIDFIRKNINAMSFRKMAEAFSEKYNFVFNISSIQKVAQRNGIKKSIRIYENGVDRRIRFDDISEKKEKFIKENFRNCKTFEELANLYERKFGVQCSRESMNMICRDKYGLSHENTGQFSKKGRSVRKALNSESIGSGYKTCVKATEKELPNGVSSNWVQKSRFIYEQKYGKIPKGCIIIHLDGNTENFDIKNLYCISRKVAGIFAQNNWWKLQKDLKILAIKWCELNFRLQTNQKANS